MRTKATLSDRALWWCAVTAPFPRALSSEGGWSGLVAMRAAEPELAQRDR
jgi:hypothetical protein